MLRVFACAMFSSEWQVDEAGYEWFPAEKTLLTRGWVLRPRGGVIRSYRPLDHPELARQFARLPLGRDAVLEFVNRWGLLDERAGARFDVISARRRQVSAVFLLLDLRAPAGSLISSAELAANAFNEMLRPSLHLQLDPSESPPRLTFSPQSLYGALCIHVATQIARLRAITACLNCGKPIAIGPGQEGTRRRKFCSDRCRFAWHRQPRES